MSVTNETILEEIKKNRKELKALIEALEVRVSLKFEDLSRRISYIEQENVILKDSIEKLERKTRENNIVIFGLKTKPEEITIDYIKKEIKNLVDVNIGESDINNFYPLAKTENPPIKVEFSTYLKKIAIFKNSKNLRKSNISIVQDQTPKQRHHNRILRKHLNLARGNNEENCFIRKNKLHVNGRTYTPEELEETEDLILEKPQSAPSTPTTVTAAKENIKFSNKLPELSVRNSQQKVHTPTSGKSSKEVSERPRMKTRTYSAK